MPRLEDFAPGLRSRDGAPGRASVFGIESMEEHAVDALAVGGDEGRRSLRKAPVSGQARDDPEMSEWGNPVACRPSPLRWSQRGELKHLSTRRKGNQLRLS